MSKLISSHLHLVYCNPTVVGVVTVKPQTESMKRKSDVIGIVSCLGGVTDAHIPNPCTKKLRRFVSDDSHSSSKVRWKSVLEEYFDQVPPSSDDETLSSDEESEERRQETAPSSVAENKTWYSVSAFAASILILFIFLNTVQETHNF